VKSTAGALPFTDSLADRVTRVCDLTLVVVTPLLDWNGWPMTVTTAVGGVDFCSPTLLGFPPPHDASSTHAQKVASVREVKDASIEFSL
jgi:hypothetical protein